MALVDRYIERHSTQHDLNLTNIDDVAPGGSDRVLYNRTVDADIGVWSEIE